MTYPGSLKDRRISTSETQVIDREVKLRFSFDGREYTAYGGDNIASALAAAGVKTFSRSFKYHRRRGLLCMRGNCPNCMVTVDGKPNVHSCKTQVENGMQVRSQNAWPSLEMDAMSLVQLIGRFLPVGFYYKAFMHPRQFWPLYEKALRRVAGLGEVNTKPVSEVSDQEFLHAEVTVIGGGPAGLQAALTAADQGAQVVLLEEETWLGGHLRYTRDQIDGKTEIQHLNQLVNRIENHENISVYPETLAIGWYDHNWIGAVRGNRLIKLRTKTLVVACGIHEYPTIFENNDLPGVMLASGIRRLLYLWGVLPGKKALVFSANQRGLQTALDLKQAGVEVPLVVELRKESDGELVQQLNNAGVQVLSSASVIKAYGGSSLTGVQIRHQVNGEEGQVDCDLLILGCGFMPANGLLYQAGGNFTWNDELKEFVPTQLPPGIFAAGEVIGTHVLEDIEREGKLAGLRASLASGYGSEAVGKQISELDRMVKEGWSSRQPWSSLNLPPPKSKKDFVCLCEDVTNSDVAHSIEEGYESIELLKRYSTMGMGPCQGKMCNANALHLAAYYNHHSVAEVGTTTSRPPIKPISLRTLAGRQLDPVRMTPMHEWHVSHDAKMMNAGFWKRPEHYGNPIEEVRAVREKVGLIDVSTLGKIHLYGSDVPNLLERVYTNRWQKLSVGQVRYGVMVNQEGIILDDGVTARIDEGLYYMTTTSSGAVQVYEWMAWWLQSGWKLDVQILPATELRAAMNLTGPMARKVLAKVIDGLDFDNQSFPYLHVRQATVAGAPALVMRIGFTGELGFEIHTPSGYGIYVWEALMEAGEEFGIQPFGVEAQRVLRLEKGHLIVGQDTDALSNPFEANLGWAVKMDKEDFLGKPALQMARRRGIEKRLVGFEMLGEEVPEEANQIVQPGDGPLGLGVIGRITSVRYSPTLNKIIGLGWLPAMIADPGQIFRVRSRGKLYSGQVVPLPFYDPEGIRLRM
jgi:sarcosine oxidase subunit alpha